MLFAAALLALAGCETTVPQDGGGIAEARSQFETASVAGDAAALASLYTEDAAVMAPNLARINGRPAIEAMWTRFFEAGTTRIAMTTTELDVHGARATDVGTFILTGRDGQGGTATLTGKYINIWQNAGAGGWQLHRGIWNYDAPG
jgi:uncharacterized protein (TIGR02246 family)